MRGDRGQERIGGSRLPVLELSRLTRVEEPGSGREHTLLAGLRTASRHLSSVILAMRLLISANSATQPTRSSSTFHSPASTPPGVSTRAISGIARSMSNQCMAWPARTASALPSGAGICSALPGSDRTEGQLPVQLGQHVLVGFHRGDLSAEADQGRGELAGSRADIDDPERPAGPDWLQCPPDRGLGVVRPVLRVGRSGGTE